jgi:hypothetical protein
MIEEQPREAITQSILISRSGHTCGSTGSGGAVLAYFVLEGDGC